MAYLLIFLSALLTGAIGFALPLVSQTEQPAPAVTGQNPAMAGDSVSLFRNWNGIAVLALDAGDEIRLAPRSSEANPAGHTADHRNCPACRQASISSVRTPIPKDATFAKAAELWLQSRNFAVPTHRYIAERTLRDENEFIKSLNYFFAALPLQEITPGHLRVYQEQRATGQLSPDSKRWAARGKGAGPNKINQELGLLIRIMKRAECWSEELENTYEPFQPLPRDIPRALTPEQQDRFLSVASSRSEWQVVYWYALLNLRIGFSNQEMRGIRLGDYSLQQAVISVQGKHAKNPGRIRSVPLAPDAAWALERLEERAKGLGSTGPQHYLFPFASRRGEYDPDRCMTNAGIKKPWQE